MIIRRRSGISFLKSLIVGVADVEESSLSLARQHCRLQLKHEHVSIMQAGGDCPEVNPVRSEVVKVREEIIIRMNAKGLVDPDLHNLGLAEEVTAQELLRRGSNHQSESRMKCEQRRIRIGLGLGIVNIRPGNF